MLCDRANDASTPEKLLSVLVRPLERSLFSLLLVSV